MKQYSNIGIANPIKMLPSLFTLFLIILHCNLSLATPATPSTDSRQNQTVSKKDQIACTVCNECENPCPVPSTTPPPPPPVVEYPPPPPPALPLPELQECPPPPRLPCPDNCNTSPSPSGPTVEPFPPNNRPNQPFPPNNRPNQPFPPNGPKPYLSPPNPIVPYFPYYYYDPSSNSVHLKLNPFVSSIVIFLTSLLCFF